MLGQMYEHQNNPSKALQCYLKSSSTSPSYTPAHLGASRVKPGYVPPSSATCRGAHVSRWLSGLVASGPALAASNARGPPTPAEPPCLDVPIGADPEVSLPRVTWEDVAVRYYEMEMYEACLPACEKAGVEGHLKDMALCRCCRYEEVAVGEGYAGVRAGRSR